jgi:hypothetical protein
MPKTAPITIRIPLELRRSILDICQNKNIALAQYIRGLIERDLNAQYTLPDIEKKYIDQAIETQTERLITFLKGGIIEKLDKICQNVGTRYDQATQKSEDLYIYMTAKFKSIRRECPDRIDGRINQYRNEFMKSHDWDKTSAAVKKDIDNYVSQCDCLYKTMDIAAAECEKENIINIFASRTFHDWSELFNKHVSDIKNIDYNAIFDTHIKANILEEINRRKQEIKEVQMSLEDFAGIRNSPHEDHVKLREYIISQLRSAENIKKRAEELRVEVKRKIGIFGKYKNITLKRLDKRQKT